MRRGISHSNHARKDSAQNGQCCHQLEKDSSSVLNTKKLRKIKALESETRCQSARSPSRDSGGRAETSRTRSVSPAPHVPPVDVKLPLEKFYKLYSKIVVQLETVKTFAENKTNETENLIDLNRQLQRADEFSIRFSRNNLYETKRIINEIKQLIVPYPFEGLSETDCKILCKKLILAYQAVSQALQTYINYAKNPSNLEVPDKINELVLLIADLFLCCEHLSLPADEVYIQNDAVRVCNDLMNVLKSKVPVFEYVELKEADLSKKKSCISKEEPKKVKKLSMYLKKLTPKVKADPPKKKFGVHCLLSAKARKMKKSEEKKARITHEIYTQKMNPRRKELGCKAVKFGGAEGEGQQQQQQKEGAEKRLFLRRPRYVTPREVRSQDDDVVTMIQTIGNDDISSCRLGSTPREADEVSNVSSGAEKSTLRELLLEAMEELHNPNEKEKKASLKKLLRSLEGCPGADRSAENNERVKVFHFVAEDVREDKKRVEPSPRVESEEKISREKTKEEEQREQEEKENEEKVNKLLFEPLGQKVVAAAAAAAGEKQKYSKARLEMTEEAMNNANKYRKAFAEYRRNNIMYRKTLANKPWELVDKISDRIILNLIEDISLDFESDAILRRLYLNELQVLS